MADAAVVQFTESFFDTEDHALLRTSSFLRQRRYSTGEEEWSYTSPRCDMDDYHARQLRPAYPLCIAFWTTYRVVNADYCDFGVRRRGYYVVRHGSAAAPKILAYLWERQSPAAAIMGARTPQHETWVAEAPFVVPPPFVDPYYPRTPDGSSSDREDAN